MSLPNEEYTTEYEAENDNQNSIEIEGIVPALARYLQSPNFMKPLAVKLANLSQEKPGESQSATSFGPPAQSAEVAPLTAAQVAAPMAVLSTAPPHAFAAAVTAPRAAAAPVSQDTLLQCLAQSVLSLPMNAMAQQFTNPTGSQPGADLIPMMPEKEADKPAKKKQKLAVPQLTGWSWRGHDSTNKRRYIALASIAKQLRVLQVSFFPQQAPAAAYMDYDRLVWSVLSEMRAIRIAETSDGGWATIAEMEAELETDDPALLQAIACAETRVKKRCSDAVEKAGRGQSFRGRARGGGSAPRQPYPVQQQLHFQQAQPFQYPILGYQQYPQQQLALPQYAPQQYVAQGYTGFAPGHTFSMGYGAGYPRPPLQQPRGCFICSAPDHYQKICPQRFQPAKKIE